MGTKHNATGMAGEFTVMAQLYRLGHNPALTLGNAKSVDILTESPSGKVYRVSVKAVTQGSKWGIGTQDYSRQKDLIFVFLFYKKFNDLTTIPEAWIIPAVDVERISRPWIGGSYAVYFDKNCAPEIEVYKNRWDFLDGATLDPKKDPYVKMSGGVLTRILTAIGGFHGKYGTWPPSIVLDPASLEVLKETHLTPAGFEYLQRKVRVHTSAKEEACIRAGDLTKGQDFDYSTEEPNLKGYTQAAEWLGLFCPNIKPR